MAHKRTNPERLHKPLNYYHSVEVDAGCKTIYLAGQTAVKSDGTTPSGIIKPASTFLIVSGVA